MLVPGRPPFTGKSTLDVVQKHKFGQFDSPRRIVPDIPHWLDGVVCQCLAKDPKDRFPDAYVLSLPVNTDIAQIRGHDGYGFPKWVTDIDVDIDAHRTTARVANHDGGTDIAIDVATPEQKRITSGTQVSTLTSYTELNGGWNATLSQTNNLAAGSALLPRNVSLELGSGRLTDDIRSLKPMKALRFDVATECQNALHIPVPVSVPAQ